MGKHIIIVPIYNEENTIRIFYQRLRKNYQEDVVFIDDGSIDKSWEFLQEIRNNNTYLIRHPMRKGYGSALISGFDFALKRGYQKIITMDADLQHEPKDIPLFLNGLEKWEVILGSRYIRIGDCLNVPRERLIINRYIRNLIKLLFGYNFTDPFCGFRGYNCNFLRKIRLEEKSYGLGLEIILEIIRIKTFYEEVPIKAIYLYPQRKFLDGLNDPKGRLLYYLDIIARKKRQIENETQDFSYKSSSRRC